MRGYSDREYSICGKDEKFLRKYKVYVHIFPDGKRYVGYTSKLPIERWNGGLGYKDQTLIFSAILKFGWNNIRHYILMDNLTESEAKIFEAAFIYNWGTYKKSRGYNTILPDITGCMDINVPTFRDCKKSRIFDLREAEAGTRIVDNQRKRRYQSKYYKKIQCIETGEIFSTIFDACKKYGVFEKNIRQAIRSGYSCGTCLIYDDEVGYEREIPAHWEYVN